MDEKEAASKTKTEKFFDWGNRNLGSVLGAVIFIASVIGIWSFYHPTLITPLHKGTQVIANQVNHEHYKADACIVACIDHRFSQTLDAFQKKQGYGAVDLIMVAGGPKDFAIGHTDTTLIAQYLCKQIAVSLKLHHSKRVDIVVHTECGAYGGEKDETFYLKELAKARSAIKEYLKDSGYNVPVHAYLETFEGMYEAN